MTDEIDCPVCYNGWSYPVTIQCAHKLCLKCAARIVAEAESHNLEPRCPMCRRALDPRHWLLGGEPLVNEHTPMDLTNDLSVYSPALRHLIDLAWQNPASVAGETEAMWFLSAFRVRWEFLVLSIHMLHPQAVAWTVGGHGDERWNTRISEIKAHLQQSSET